MFLKKFHGRDRFPRTAISLREEHDLQVAKEPLRTAAWTGESSIALEAICLSCHSVVSVRRSAVKAVK
jgi:hypothetical protein